MSGGAYRQVLQDLQPDPEQPPTESNEVTIGTWWRGRTLGRVLLLATCMIATLALVAVLQRLRPAQPDAPEPRLAEQVIEEEAPVPPEPRLAKNVIEEEPPVSLEPNDPCTGFDYITLQKVIHNNLGNRGPHEGSEGMVFMAEDVRPDGNGFHVRPLLLVLNASNTTPYATLPQGNGLFGKYAMLNCKGGTKVAVTFSFLDPTTREPITIRKLHFSFFDLDTHHTGSEVEYVKVWNYSSFLLMEDTQLSAAIEPLDGSATFTASKPGASDNNPEDPLALSPEQRRKAVTVQFGEVSSFRAEFGSSDKLPLSGYRGFSFIPRPSLKCHAAAMGTRPPPPTLTTTAPSPAMPHKEQSCWFKVPVVDWCVPSR